MTRPRPLLRRAFLQGVGSIAVLTPVACGSDSSSQGAGGAAGQGGAAGAGGSGAGGQPGSGGQGGSPSVCVLTPQQTEGPYYLDDDLQRSEITEGKPGVPLTMIVRVVQLPDCVPLVAVPVDLWHADAFGLYSGYPGQGDNTDIDTSGLTFLRGTADTSADGTVTFQTVWPGWYPGRAIHIHFKVRLPNNMEVTSQLYFPDAFNAAVHELEPYSTHGPALTGNAQDGIFAATADNAALVSEVSGNAAGYTAELTVGIAG
jgi:protocatechuate 3,4-dioxygenase beta subunit